MPDILRVYKVNSTKTNFVMHCSTLVYRMINQGGNVDTISKALKHLADTFRLLVSSLQHH